MSSTTNLNTLKINYMTQAQYDTALSGGQVNEDEIYVTPNSSLYKELTQAEYDALTEAEKNDGTVYFISDAAAELTAVDYVVEQGTSGIWTYRKWNSGIAECWGITNSATFSMTTNWGGAYYASGTATTNIYFPSGLFTTTPVVSITRTGSGGGSGLVLASPHTVNTTSIAFYAIDTASGTRTCQYGIEAKGRWK